MQLVNHEPVIKTFGNGFQITFPNLYTVIIKNGLSTKSTQTKNLDDITDTILSSRFGGNSGPDVEVEIYDPKKVNISDKFGEANSIGFVSTIQLVSLLYIVSALK